MRDKKVIKLFFLLWAFCFLTFNLTGCAIRTRKVIKERVDQDLSQGNRGYIYGSMPIQEPKERKKTRQTYEIEIELSNPFKFKRLPAEDETQGLSVSSEDMDFVQELTPSVITDEEEELDFGQEVTTFETYTVQSGDTLQKISRKFYGTTRKWKKIYEVNEEVLKSPDRVYPGQKLMIPKE